MRIEQLIWLKDLSETNSITETAQHFFITQQGLSNAIKMLEKEYNETFLNRTNHGVSLTPAGETFLHAAEKLIDAYNDLNSTFHLYDEEALNLQDTVTIACHARLMDSFLIDIIETSSIMYPNLHLKILEAQNNEAIDMVYQSQADIGLSISFLERNFMPSLTVPDYETVHSSVLHTDFYVCCCKKTHPLTEYDTVSYEQLSSYPIIHFQNNQFSDNLYNNPDKNIYNTNNTSFHRALIKRGLGIGFISAFEFRKLYQKHSYLTALTVDPPLHFQIKLYQKNDKVYTSSVQKIIELIQNYNFHSK